MSSQLSLVRVLVIGARGIPNAEGGAEKNAEVLFPLLAAKGYDITLMGLKENILSTSYRGVKLLAAPSIKLFNTDKIAYYISGIVHSIILRPNIVHLQGLGSAIFLLVYKMLGRKVVVRYGSADYILPKWGSVGRLGFLLSEWQLRFADAVISVTPALTKRLATRGITSNVHTIPNALDQPHPLVNSEVVRTRPYILMVGRVTSQKNVTTLLAAFDQFLIENPEYELLIAGGLDDAAYVKNLKPLLSNRIILLGRVPRDEVPALLLGANLFVNVSLHEGSSNATLEAISYGRPVVLSDIPENRDIQLPDRFYVDPTDTKAIAKSFGDAVRSPGLYILDKNLFLTWGQVAEQTEKIYYSIASRK